LPVKNEKEILQGCVVHVLVPRSWSNWPARGQRDSSPAL
jgi:hypothetical protein